MSSSRYWLGTCFCDHRPAELPSDCVWIRGQQEECPTTERLHWQMFASFAKPQRLAAVRSKFCGCHWEPSRSQAAEEYVWKEDTRVPETQFEVGSKPLRRNNRGDWDAIRQEAQAGNLQNIPADVYVRYYR